MKQIFIILMILITAILGAQVDTLYILQTTDIHGHALSYNYKTNQATDHGLDRIATLVDSFRQHHKNVLLLETGDLFQGSPLSDYYFNHQQSEQNPIIDVVNYMQYDAFAVGNHEIEYGPEIYNQLETQCNFPWLSANAKVSQDSTYFKPYEIVEKAGLRIGIIGLTTPAIPLWLNIDKYPGIEWEAMVPAAGRYAEKIRDDVDLMLGLFHAGLDWKEGEKETQLKGLPRENESSIVGIAIDGFSFIFSGHSHNTFPKKRITITKSEGPLYVNSGCHGYNLGVAEIVFSKTEEDIEIIRRSTWNINSAHAKPHPEVVKIMKPAHEKVLAYLDSAIVNIENTVTTENAYFQDNIVTEWINQAQLDYTGADISMACCFNTKIFLQNEPFRVKDAYAAYPYENTLYVVELTGSQVKDYLERSAEFYNVSNGNIGRSSNIAGYNYDMAEGISYEIHPDQPIGSRIKNLTFNDNPLNENQSYKVALNSFRFNGGGGLLTIDESELRVISETDKKVRDILIDYLRSNKNILRNPDNNWKLKQ